MRKSALLLSTTLTLGLGQAGLAADWDALTHAGGQSANWLVYGGQSRQYPLRRNDEINVDNVGDLELKWIFQTGIIGSFETPLSLRTALCTSRRRITTCSRLTRALGVSSGTTSTSSAPRSSAVARTIGAWRWPTTRSTWRPSTPC